MNNVFRAGIEVIKEIEQHGEQAYFIGGAVRDFIMKREVQDVDIASSASIDKLKEIFPHVIPVGVEHGTIIVRYQNISFEISTFRPLEEKNPTLYSDVNCRDFTINAIAMSRTFNLIDYVDGKYAILNKEIKAVGDAEKRITEDPLRILRALRFVSSFDFPIEENTLASMHKQGFLLKEVATERLTQEWKKMIQGPYQYKAMDKLMGLNIYHYLPVFHKYPQLFEKNIQYIRAINNIAVFFAVLHMKKPEISVQSWVKAWKLSNKDKQAIQYLLSMFTLFKDHGVDKWFVYRLDPFFEPLFIDMYSILDANRLEDVSIQTFRDIRRQLTIHSVQDVPINGKDIIQTYPEIKQGPWIAHMMEEIQYAIVMNQLENKKHKIKEWILCHPPEIN